MFSYLIFNDLFFIHMQMCTHNQIKQVSVEMVILKTVWPAYKMIARDSDWDLE